MAVGVLAVSRLARSADSEQREHAGGEVEKRVGRLAQDAKAPRQQADEQLRHDQSHSNRDRCQRDELWTPLQRVHQPTLSAGLKSP